MLQRHPPWRPYVHSENRDPVEIGTKIFKGSIVSPVIRIKRNLVFRGLPWDIATILLLLGLAACDRAEPPAQYHIAGADPQAGRAVMADIACGICHVVPGIR